MADSYYDLASRAGLMPAGMNSYANPSSVGGFTTSNLVTAPNSYLSSPQAFPMRPAAPAVNPVTALADEYKALLKASNEANTGRDVEGRKLLGIPTGNEWKEAGFNTPGAYEAHKAFTAAPANAPAPAPQPLDVNSYVKAALGDTRQRAIDRGIYNTSEALNKEGENATRAAQEAAAANFQQASQAYQLNEGTRRFDTDQADQKLGRQLAWIDGRNDIPPNMDRLAQIASTLGQGNTEGMSFPSGGGGGGGGASIGGSGYGGAANAGYFLPQNNGFATPNAQTLQARYVSPQTAASAAKVVAKPAAAIPSLAARGMQGVVSGISGAVSGLGSYLPSFAGIAQQGMDDNITSNRPQMVGNALTSIDAFLRGAKKPIQSYF